MDWYTKRKTLYLVIFVFIIVSIFAYFLRGVINREPTCYDGIQNGEERGVDCSGGCNLICPKDYKPLSVTTARAIKVSENKYDIVVLVENNNKGIAPKFLDVIVDLYDNTGAKIKSLRASVVGSTGPVTPVYFDGFEAKNITTVLAKVGNLEMHRSTGSYDVNLKRFTYQNSNNKTNVNVYYESPYEEEITRGFSMMVVMYNSLNNIVGYKVVNVDKLEVDKQKELFINLPYKIEGDIASVKLIPMSILYAE